MHALVCMYVYICIRVTMQGEFPRTISLFRTSYSFVAWHREWVHPDLSLLFLCQYAPDVSTYAPIFVRGEQLAPSWTSGSMHMYSDQSGWYIHIYTYIHIYKHTYIYIYKIHYYNIFMYMHTYMFDDLSQYFMRIYIYLHNKYVCMYVCINVMCFHLRVSSTICFSKFQLCVLLSLLVSVVGVLCGWKLRGQILSLRHGSGQVSTESTADGSIR